MEVYHLVSDIILNSFGYFLNDRQHMYIHLNYHESLPKITYALVRRIRKHSEGNYVCRNSQRILVEAAYIGVFRREESSLRRIPQSSLPVPKFAAKVVPCSYPLIVTK